MILITGSALKSDKGVYDYKHKLQVILRKLLREDLRHIKLNSHLRKL